MLIYIRTTAVTKIAMVWQEDEETKTFLQAAVADEDWDVRRSAIEGLVKAYPEDGGVRVDSFLLYDVITSFVGIQRNIRLLHFI